MTIRQILLIPHTHHDIGYTNSPRIVDELHTGIVGEVLRLCDLHGAPGPDGRSGLRVQPAERLLAEVRPLGEGAVRVRLRNITGEPVDAVVSWEGEAGTKSESVRVGGHDAADVTLLRSEVP